MLKISELNPYYYFDGIRSKAVLRGHEDIKQLSKELSEGKFIDSYERLEDSVEISYENRPHINY
jgi:hypothetical protein